MRRSRSGFGEGTREAEPARAAERVPWTPPPGGSARLECPRQAPSHSSAFPAMCPSCVQVSPPFILCPTAPKFKFLQHTQLSFHSLPRHPSHHLRPFAPKHMMSKLTTPSPQRHHHLSPLRFGTNSSLSSLPREQGGCEQRYPPFPISHRRT